MKRLYLTSSVNFVAKDLSADFDLRTKSRLAFITTAAEGEEGDKAWLDKDRQALTDAGFSLFDYTITNKHEGELRQDLASSEYLYLSGGNTFYLLEKAQQSNFIQVVRDFVLNDEKVYISTSAGSIIAGPDTYPALRLDAVEKASNLKGYKGFGLVDFVVFPHWGSEHFKKLYLQFRLEHAYTPDHKIILLTDNQYIAVKDDWYHIVSVEKIYV